MQIISVSLDFHPIAEYKIPKGLVISKMRGMETIKESEIISDPRETQGASSICLMEWHQWIKW